MENINEKIINLNLMGFLSNDMNYLKNKIDLKNYEVKEIKQYKYINLYEDGLSFCLNNDIIESIHIYNQNIMKFKRF